MDRRCHCGAREERKSMFLRYEMGDQSLQRSCPVLKTRQTEILPFAVTNLGDFTCDSTYFTRRQGLEECLCLYTISGEGTGEFEGKTVSLKPGEILVLDCREYQYYATLREPWHFLWFHFAGKCAFDYVRLLNSGGIGPIYLGNRISFPSYYEKLYSHAAQLDLQGELVMSATLQNLLTDLIQLKNTENFSAKYGRYRQELEASISYMLEHFKENLTVEQLAGLCHMSKYYYIKIFKEYTGQTPYEFLMGIRLQQAQKMLLETGKTVEEIGQETGFGDSRNFIACFKKKAGLTPLRFRKQNQVGI